MQQWVDEQSEEGDDVFKMFDFDFMPVGMTLIDGKIRHNPTNQSQQEG